MELIFKFIGCRKEYREKEVYIIGEILDKFHFPELLLFKALFNYIE